jgi:hypothetical protein
MNDTGRMRLPPRQEITATEAEALVASGWRIDQIIWFEFRSHQWAEVEHGDWMPVFGEVLIADLLRLGHDGHRHRERVRDDEPWSLRWSDTRQRWRGSGISIGPGVQWWSEDVGYRHISTGWGWLGGQQDDA